VKLLEDGTFDCSTERWLQGLIPGLVFKSSFPVPSRQSSVIEVVSGLAMVRFNLTVSRQYSAASNIVFIVVILILMGATCLLMSSSVSVVVLKPLERVFTVVRHHCAEIVRVSTPLHEEAAQDTHLDEFAEEEASEVALLEKVLTRISGICENLVPEEIQGRSTEESMLLANFTGRNNSTGFGTIIKQDVFVRVSLTASEEDVALLDEAMRKEVELHTFNVFKVESPELQQAIALYSILTSRVCGDWTRQHIKRDRLENFVAMSQSNYKANPFHSFEHGLDVLGELRRYLHEISANQIFPEDLLFALLVGAVGHDMGHPGVNNIFLVETAHEYALTYNDQSPLENLHCALLFQVLNDKAVSIFQDCSKSTFKKIRACIVDAILHTDMIKHNECVKDLGILYAMNTEAFINQGGELQFMLDGEPSNRQLVMNALLHCADVSNPMKPWDVCEFLADRCLEEFFCQGDQEKALGIPVQMLNDRDKVNRPNSQVGFIEFVISPLAFQVVTLFPPLCYLATSLGSNITTWSNIWKETTQPSEEQWGKLQTRVKKVTDRCRDLKSESEQKLTSK